MITNHPEVAKLAPKTFQLLEKLTPAKRQGFLAIADFLLHPTHAVLEFADATAVDVGNARGNLFAALEQRLERTPEASAQDIITQLFNPSLN